MAVLAYHLTWTTYGTWLPGDARGWVKKNAPGIQPPNPKREQRARDLMVEPAVLLTPQQRMLVEQTLREHCRRRRWHIHAVHVCSNHVHLVVTAERDPDDVMNQFKAWCSRRLSDSAGLRDPTATRAGRRRWFTEGGHKKVIEDERYLENAIRYVLEGQ